MPTDAASPMEAGVRRVPADNSKSSALHSDPRGTTFSPDVTGRWTSTLSPFRCVYSTITTASAPAGTGAPVMISTASCDPTCNADSAAEAPARISPTTFSATGVFATSAARTANPSRVARRNGGKSRSARICSASTRRAAAIRSMVSAVPDVTCEACCSTIFRACSNETIACAGFVTMEAF